MNIFFEIPLRFSKVSLPREVGERIKILNSAVLHEKVVLLSSVHDGNALYIGRVKTDPEDKECYYFQRPNSDGSFTEIRRWYHDISELYEGDGPRIKQKFKFRKEYKLMPFEQL